MSVVVTRVWSPDTDPAHALCHLVDCLLAAHHQAARDRRPDDAPPSPAGGVRVGDVRPHLAEVRLVIRRRLGDGALDRLAATALARLVRAGDAPAAADTAVAAAVVGLNGLLALPAGRPVRGESDALAAAEAARAGLVRALARCGEPPPLHDWRGIPDPMAVLPADFRPGGAFVIATPPQYTPAVPPGRPAGEVEMHAPDGPGPDQTIRWRGRSVRLKGVRFRVVSFMWTRQSVGFDELAGYVNEHRAHATPTPEGFKTWVSRGNEALAPLGLPHRLRASTVDRLIYWEDVRDVMLPVGGFRSETADETAVSPA